ncbi:AtpZ/AtpI family protein [Sulfurihydrogenibium azorense]|jgi:ATP synthase protein I|uniref:ATP synthase protein I n=1 Tax=Sulfurihydrogenibium azorense (strain DSM 15241 / OCM 825 / Az-Fu1) TaxID=204536 RepID=C1DWF2_SULAA|nr:AtpZ/AtpI family protein [Sulfurihydrogenibium azorense]ACN99518.1 ATP synthase protein I [Sulfurihydrogenibium azorense Az-Fu1]MDM7273339.1 AtpZ/AtpI family protein [Sulfurihydrogenibium azorense]
MSKEVNRTFSFLSIGLHLVSGVIVGVTIGYLLDKYFGTSPYLTIIFFFLGLAAGFRNMYIDAKKYIQSEEKNN